MKYIILIIISISLLISLLISAAWAENKPWGMSDYDWGYANGYKQGLETGKNNAEKGALNDIYSMVADLETKFMGVDRMEQICMPELHEKKLLNKIRREPNWNGKGKL